MGRKLPEPQVIWNEELHIFLPVGPGRWQHYTRELGRRMFGAERLYEPNTYTLEEAQTWCAAHNPEPLTDAEVYAVKSYPGTDEEMLGDSKRE